MSGFFTIIESAANGLGSAIIPQTTSIAGATTATAASTAQTLKTSSATSSSDVKSRTKTESGKDQDQTKSSATKTSVSSTNTPRPDITSSDTDASTSLPTLSPSTFETSTIPSSVFSVSITQPSETSTPTPASVKAAESANNIPVAGIVVASFMSLFAFLTVLFLIFRYCSPIRRRYEAWQEKKREVRTHRDAIDGIAISAHKLGSDGSLKASSLNGQRFYAQDEPELNTRVPHVQGTGLGLGNRLSLLRQHAPFQMGGASTRVSQIGMAVGSPRHDRPPAPLPK